MMGLIVFLFDQLRLCQDTEDFTPIRPTTYLAIAKRPPAERSEGVHFIQCETDDDQTEREIFSEYSRDVHVITEFRDDLPEYNQEVARIAPRSEILPQPHTSTSLSREQRPSHKSTRYSNSTAQLNSLKNVQTHTSTDILGEETTLLPKPNH